MSDIETIHIVEVLDQIKTWRDSEIEKPNPSTTRIDMLNKLYQCVRLSIVSNQALQEVQRENVHYKVLVDVYKHRLVDCENELSVYKKITPAAPYFEHKILKDVIK